MDVIEKIEAMIAPSLDAMGYAIVQLKMADGSGRKTLSLMAERKDQQIMGFDDCEAISRAVSALMDVEDPITSAYDLEVCSPGVDRPLVRLEDFTRYVGHEAKLESMLPINGRKRFRGVIVRVEGASVILKTDDGEAEVPFSNIRNAKLVMTDALLRSFLKQQKREKEAKQKEEKQKKLQKKGKLQSE